MTQAGPIAFVGIPAERLPWALMRAIVEGGFAQLTRPALYAFLRQHAPEIQQLKDRWPPYAALAKQALDEYDQALKTGWAEAEADPLVRTILQTFPGAKLERVRPATPQQTPEPQDEAADA